MRTVPLGNVVEVSAGQPAPGPNEFSDKGHPFIRAGSLEGLLNGYTEEACEKIAQETAKRKRLNLYPKGTVLFAKSGMSAKLGRVYHLREPAYVVSHLAALAPTGKYDPSYLTYWLQANPPSRLIKDDAYPSIRISEIATLEVPDVDLDEQRRIANILDKADALRAKRRAALAQLDELAYSIFLEMFGEKIVVDSAMSNVAGVASQRPGSIRTGPFGSQLLHSEFTDSGIAVLGIDNAVHNEFRWGDRRYISEYKYQQLERYTVHPGDILITIMGTCGRCAIVPNDIPLAINTKHLCCITLNTSKCLPIFLHAYFLQHTIARRYLTRKAKGAIMSGLNMSIIKDLPVPLVPMKDQYVFARRIEAIEALKSQHRTALGQFDELFASLQQRAFRGEL